MKTLRTTLSTALLFLCSGTALAYDFEAGGIYYKVLSVSERTVGVTFMTPEFDPNNPPQSYAGTVNIPATVDYQGVSFAVTTVCENAFNHCTGLAHVTLPVGLRSIENYAFSDCTGLDDTDIPNTVTSIGYDAFASCHAFTRVVIPPSVTTIGSYAFTSDGVQSITIEDAPNGIDAGGWWGRAFVFPNVVQAYVGRDCGGWQAPASLIDHWYGNGRLQRVEFGPQVTEVPYCMLYGDAYNLTELVLSPNTKRIAWGALSGCYALKRLELPDGVEEIGDYALSGGWGDKDMALTDLVIGDKIASIGSNAFTGCRRLQTVTVRRTDAIAIPEDAFHAQTYLNATLYVPVGSQDYQQTAYWSNFLRISEGEATPATRWPVTVIVSDGGSVKALGHDLCATTYTENVEEGTEVSVLFSPDDGWDLTALTLNGTDVMADVTESAYTMPAIKSRDTLRVTFSQPEATLTLRTSEQGTVTQSVVFGTRCSLRITAAEGYVVHSITLDGEDITETMEADGSLLTPAINGHSLLSVAFEKDPAGIAEISLSTLRILPGNGRLTLQGLKVGTIVSVHTADGTLVTRHRATSVIEQLALPARQVYLITAEGRSVKVAL